MDCPRCKLVNPPGAKRCDCGYDFETQTLEKSYLRQNVPKDVKSDTQQPVVPASQFFAVGSAKYVALSVTTFNLYHLVWLWQHWRHRRNVVGESVLPAVRSVLFPWIFTIPLGYRIAKASVASGTAGWSPALAAATLWTLSAVGSAFLPDGPMVLLGFLPVLFGVWLQKLANRVNAAVAPSHETNQRFTPVNWVVIVVGGIFLLLAIMGLLLPADAVDVEAPL